MTTWGSIRRPAPAGSASGRRGSSSPRRGHSLEAVSWPEGPVRRYCGVMVGPWFYFWTTCRSAGLDQQTKALQPKIQDSARGTAEAKAYWTSEKTHQGFARVCGTFLVVEPLSWRLGDCLKPPRISRVGGQSH